MPEQAPYRLFVALTLPEAVKAEVERAQGELRRALEDARVSWTRVEQFHLTLRFLGNVEAARVEGLAQAVREVCSGFVPLRLRAEQLGCFPSPRAPRVIWAGVTDSAGDLPRLHGAVERACAGFSAEPPAERFSGHVTLGRIKSIGRTEAEALAGLLRAMAGRFFGQWTSQHIEVMRSELSPQGAHHTVLAQVPLGGSSY